ncbi:ketose-bisphosphate aldolase [Caldicellulosiruptoraceae bacterium PP1]
MGVNSSYKVYNLKTVLDIARKYKFAVGAFSPRSTAMILPILRAAEKNNSLAIVQISQKELLKYEITPKQFAEEFFECLDRYNLNVHVVLHLDHTKDIKIIHDAIDARFTSVMIDASDKPLEENIKITKEVVEYAHSKGVSVEAELGMIGTTDFVETDKDEELYTNPEEAKYFVEKTNVDALAVSVGTAHGVYSSIRQPKIDYNRLIEIGELTDVHLVLHGGSGIPAQMIVKAIKLEKGSISKVNIATDLELELLRAINKTNSLKNSELNALEKGLLEKGRNAVEDLVIAKMDDFLLSKDSAKFI